MSWLEINTSKIINNIKKIDKFLGKYNIKWTLVVKVLSGSDQVLKKILLECPFNNLNSIGDSRLSNLKRIKQIRPDLVTAYIKPPAIRYIKNVVKYADISFNTSYKTLSALDKEAKLQNKIHKVIIMIELGELREGIMRDNLISFYQKTFALKNIQIIGLGTNLGCMYGIDPSYDKLIQLVLYKQLIEAKFNKKIELISGGSSITLPLVGKRKFPHKINHLRIGEAVFLGTSPMTNSRFKDLNTDAFSFKSNIIELKKKPILPSGSSGNGNVGHAVIPDNIDEEHMSYRAVLDFGIIDVDVKNITPIDQNIKFVGTTSDMTVYDLGLRNKNELTREVGNYITFKPNYMAVARLMNAKYIEKQII